MKSKEHPVMVRLSPEKYALLKKLAKSQGRSLGRQLAYAFDAYIWTVKEGRTP